MAQDVEVCDRIREQFQRNAAHWPMRLDNHRGGLPGQQLVMGDWVLEFVSGPVPALQSMVKGPYLVVEFAGQYGQHAVVGTGRTDPVRFRRHVNNLARYKFYGRHHMHGV